MKRVRTEDLLHEEIKSDRQGWYVEMISDAKRPRLHTGYVNGFLKDSNAQQHRPSLMIDRLKAAAQNAREAAHN